MTLQHLRYIAPTALLELRESATNPKNWRKAKRNPRISRGPVRKYVWRGKVYVIRDVRIVRSHAGEGALYPSWWVICCEYAVRNPNGSKRWVPTYEGVMFDNIQAWSFCRVH